MKLSADLAGSSHQIIVKRDGGKVFARIDGREYELVLREFSDGGYLLIDGHEVYNCQVGISAEHLGHFAVTLRGATYDIAIADPKRLRTDQTAGSHDHGEAQIRATMPGKVVRLLVELGAQVEAGAGIIVVEAMKMQNELKTPKAGKVSKLSASVGETVNAGDVLAVVE